MKKRRRSALDAPIDRARMEQELAAGYMFPELFEQPTSSGYPSLTLQRQEATERQYGRDLSHPDQPIQPRLFTPPPIDYDHIRQKDAEKRRAARAARQRRRRPLAPIVVDSEPTA